MDDLAALLSKTADPLHIRSAREIVSRWQRLGLAEAHRPTNGLSVITATTTGAAWAGVTAPTGLPGWGQLPHTLTVAALAIAYRRGGALWTPEPLIVLPPGCEHRPDGIAHPANGNGTTAATAVEVELTQKSAQRLAVIVPDLLDNWQNVAYWATPKVGAAVSKWAAHNLRADEQQRLTVRDLGAWTR